MPNKYFGASQDALRMMIPLVVNQRNIEANAAEQNKRLDFLRQQGEEQTTRALAKLEEEKNAAQQKEQTDWLLKRLETAETTGDRPAFEKLAPMVEQRMGAQLPKYFSAPEGLERYHMGAPKPQDPSYDIRDTEQGIMAFDRRNPQAPPISTGVQGKQQKWEVYPPGAGGDTKDPISRTVDLGDKVRVFKRDGSFEDMPKSASPTATEQSTRPPKGYRWNENKELEPIPGSQADIKVRREYAADVAATDKVEDTLSRTTKAIDAVLKNDNGLKWLTGYTGYAPDWVSQDKKDASIKLDELRNKLFVQAVEAMRQASTNGSTGLGQLTEREGDKIQNSIVNLEKAQSYEQMKAALEEIRSVVEAARIRTKNKFNYEWEGRTPKPLGQKNEWRDESLQLKTAEDYFNKKFGGE